mgnify:CR=1 FL=1
MPQMIKLYQIVIDRHLSDLINSEGWECHSTAKSKLAAMNGDPRLAIANECYTHVADIVADDIDHAFEAGNSGPSDRVIPVEGTKMHSVSGGDVLQDNEGLWFVDRIGYKEVLWRKDQEIA